VALSIGIVSTSGMCSDVGDYLEIKIQGGGEGEGEDTEKDGHKSILRASFCCC
jgi:hypothetical protein